MEIFRLNPPECEYKYCFVSGNFPYGNGFREGTAVLPLMKEHGVDLLDYSLDEDEGGLEIGDYFTNTTGILPVSRKFADALKDEFDLGSCELIPSRVRNAKKRVHVQEMTTVNPLGRIDCLDWEQSQLDGDVENPLVAIFGAWSLKQSRVPAGLDVFRVKALTGYLFSERLVNFIREKKLKNFVFEEARLT